MGKTGCRTSEADVLQCEQSGFQVGGGRKDARWVGPMPYNANRAASRWAGGQGCRVVEADALQCEQSGFQVGQGVGHKAAIPADVPLITEPDA
jgi:hypothetical protein